jgi:hypothetical protein
MSDAAPNASQRLLEGSLVMKGNNYECILFNDGFFFLLSAGTYGGVYDLVQVGPK